MHQLNVTLAVAALAVIVLGMISAKVQQAPLGRPMLALAVGVLAGPEVLAWIRPEQWPDKHLILKEAARFTLAMSVMAIAMRTPIEDLRRFARPLALLLTAGMLAMWAVSAGLAWAALGLSPVLALLVGAAVTPTDPVVASSIVTGRTAEETLPDRTRSTLSLESGANDGLAYLFVLLPILMLTQAGAVWQRWVVDVLLVGVVAAVAIGAAAGVALGFVMHRADKTGWIAHSSMLGLSIALAFFAVSAARLAGSDGILAAFAAGLALNATVDRSEELEDEKVQEAISKLFTLPVFVLFGALLPWGEWTALGWPAAGLAAAVLLLRRPLTVLLLGPVLGGGLDRRDKWFLGWFGPVGVAAIYYALHGLERTGETVLWSSVSLVVAASVLVHGVTSGPGLKLFARS
jgi:sodium/hydrogen antiporter